MSYQERSIPPEQLEKLITILDSDEGIRIDDRTDHIFVNRTGKSPMAGSQAKGLKFARVDSSNQLEE